MAVLKYKDPETGKIQIVGVPKQGVQYVTVTMMASGWSGNTYSFEAEYPHAQYNISIEVSPTATTEQFEAFGGAMICGSADSNVATAIGDVPTIDIPIIVKVVAK
jgi:hypothetical protein